MKNLIERIETTEGAISYFLENATEQQWRAIEESLLMAKFKADLGLKPSLFKALLWPIDRTSYINYLEEFQKWTPLESDDKIWRKPGAKHSQEVYDRLCHFYFLIDQPTGIGRLVFAIDWFQKYVALYAENWGSYLKTEASFNDAILIKFLKHTPQYKIQDSVINGKPHKPWNCFNDFFARQLNAGLRPISEPTNNSVVSSPADCYFRNYHLINSNSEIEPVTIKQTHRFTNIQELLKESKYASSFANGTLLHYVLDPHSYHRFHSPVSGLVQESYPVWGIRNVSISIGTEGNFETETNHINGYQFSQARGVLTLDTRNSPHGDMGIVAIIPIGLCQAASVHLLATPDTVVEKGEEVGYFKFGGSDILLVFQEGKAPIFDTSDIFRHYGTNIAELPLEKL